MYFYFSWTSFNCWGQTVINTVQIKHSGLNGLDAFALYHENPYPYQDRKELTAQFELSWRVADHDFNWLPSLTMKSLLTLLPVEKNAGNNSFMCNHLV